MKCQRIKILAGLVAKENNCFLFFKRKGRKKGRKGGRIENVTFSYKDQSWTNASDKSHDPEKDTEPDGVSWARNRVSSE